MNQELKELLKQKGALRHLCPDWDGLAIDETCPEIEACLCDKDGIAQVNRERDLKWDRRYLRLAYEIAGWSKDPSTTVGAVLVRPNNSVASTGFNGFPAGESDAPELYADRAYKYEHVVHAEANAFRFLAEAANRQNNGIKGLCTGFTLYTSFPCCPNCMALAAQAGVTRVVGPPINFSGKSEEWKNEWRARIIESAETAEKNGIAWDVVSAFDTLVE